MGAGTKEPTCRALMLHDGDDVAVVIAHVPAGELCEIATPSAKWTVRAVSDVAFGHKISVHAIDCGQAVIKYGQRIGHASAAIDAGAHVHVHNLQGGAST